MGVIFSHKVKNPGLLGRKIGMSQFFNDQGKAVPVTLVQLGPCVVVQKKEKEVSGYNSLQLGFGYIRKVLVSVPLAKYFEKQGIEPKRYLKEFRGFDVSQYNVGDEIKADIFTENDKVDVVGLTKGKGFAGVHKRFGFGGGRKTHGSHFHRAPGAIGACATPGKTLKGIKLPGHMGNNRVTTKNLEIVYIDMEKNIVAIKGAIPGRPDSVVAVTKKNGGAK